MWGRGSQQAHRDVGEDSRFHDYLSSAYRKSEAHAEAQRNKISINFGVVTPAEKIGVAEAGAILVEITCIQPEANGLGPFDEIVVGTIAGYVMRPGQVGF